MEVKTQELDLFKKFKSGDLDSKRQLIKSLTPLINMQVSKFSASGLPIPAIKLEGQKLTSQAIDTYDPSKAQLNTHVTNYLKKLNRFVSDYQNVGHIPEPRTMIIGKYNTLYSNLEADKKRPPTVEELSDAMQIPIAEVSRLQSELRKDLSLTYDLDKDSDDIGGFYSFVSPSTTDPKLHEAIEFVYFDSDNIDKKILEMTLGLYGNPKRSLKDIATILKLSDSELKERKTNLAIQIKELITIA